MMIIAYGLNLYNNYQIWVGSVESMSYRAWRSKPNDYNVWMVPGTFDGSEE